MKLNLLQLHRQLEAERRFRYDLDQRCKHLMESELTSSVQELSKVADYVSIGVYESKDASSYKETQSAPEMGNTNDDVMTSRCDNNEQTCTPLLSAQENLLRIVEAISHLEETNDNCLTRTAVTQACDQDCALMDVCGANCETIYIEETMLGEHEMTQIACKTTENLQMYAAAEVLQYFAGGHGKFRQLGLVQAVP